MTLVCWYEETPLPVAANVMVKLCYSLVYSHLTYALLAVGKIETYYCYAHRRACEVITDYNQKIPIFHSIYDYFALLKAFNTNTGNFHQYFEDKLSSHQPSHMHDTRYRTNRNFNNPLFNHSKTQKCYLYRIIQILNSMCQHSQIALPVYIKKNKLKATSTPGTCCTDLYRARWAQVVLPIRVWVKGHSIRSTISDALPIPVVVDCN